MLDCISWLQARNLNCEECWVLHRTLEEMELSKGSTWSTSQTLFQTRKQILKLEKLDVLFFAWILLPGQTTSFFEFYSSSLSIPPVSGSSQQCQIITLLCCEERGEMNGRQRDREKGTIWCLTRILENTNIDCGTSHISAVHSLEKKQNQTLILTSRFCTFVEFSS